MARHADLPTWHETPEGWTTDAPAELAFAHRCVIAGFDLRRFDDWLRELEPCPARDELMALRREAKAAARPAMRRTLEHIAARRFLIEREDFLLPLAQRGAKFRAGKPKGSAGPMRKLIRDMLKSKKAAAMTARELWQACAALPERKRRGIDFEAADNAFVSGHGNVSFSRFANIVSEERRARK